jgi:serine/threonine protein kinase
MTRRSSRRRSPGHNGSNYDTPRWKDEGEFPGARKEFVRKATERASGREGVLKHVSGRDMRRRRRFYDEAVKMHRMNGTPGILPVWDIDDTRRDEPRWYAMPPAQLLDDALGDDGTLRDVVGHIAFLADVLTRLADQDTYHRDIKPANLFWWDGGPVLADFGIAAWGTDSSQAGAARRASLTRAGEKLGPANFIAPEMRHYNPTDPGKRADVYSLAKTLFVLALPGRGPYPPDGTHHADSEEFSLWETSSPRQIPGGNARSLAELRHVLEAATAFEPLRRLSMADFRDELHAWLPRYPDVQFRPRGDKPKHQYGWEMLRVSDELNRRDREETRSMMLPCIREIAKALTGDPEAWAEEDDHYGGQVLGDYGGEPNDGWGA